MNTKKQYAKIQKTYEDYLETLHFYNEKRLRHVRSIPLCVQTLQELASVLELRYKETQDEKYLKESE